MKTKLFAASTCLVLASCGAAIPFPYPQIAPIPEFSGRIHGYGSSGSLVEIYGHPETATTTDRSGYFRTNAGSDFFFGRDQFYFPKDYRLAASMNGKIHSVWSVQRPPMLGRYKNQPDHAKTIEVGDLRDTGRLSLRDLR